MGPRKTAKHKAAGPPSAQPTAMPSPALDPTAGQAPQTSLGTLHQMEEKKKRLNHQLKDVERQIFDLETRYLEGIQPNANALTGYEGLRSAVSSSKPSKGAAIAPEDRIFSGSSTTTR